MRVALFKIRLLNICVQNIGHLLRACL